MSLPSKIAQSSSRVNATRRPNTRAISNAPLSVIDRLESTTKSPFDFDVDDVPTWPAIRYTSLHPTEDSETTILDMYHDSGTRDDVSSTTLQNERPWYEAGVDKGAPRVPSTILPALLQNMTDVSPPRPPWDDAQFVLRPMGENSDSDEALPRLSAAQKGKWKACAGDDTVHAGGRVGTESLQFDFRGMDDSVNAWVAHNTPVLRDYADRQVSLPLGRRLQVSMDEPSQFILGALQLLVNRDQPGCTDCSRQLGPQLIENFVDIERWAKEYFRSRYRAQVVDSDVPALLTIVLNNFYDGHIQLIDRLVESALENMHICGRSTLGVEDFAFGFDFKMSQDLPFYVETCSQVREPLPIRNVEMHSTVEPVVTSSGRQVKPTKRAQASAEQAQTSSPSGRENTSSNPSRVKDKQAAGSPVPDTRQTKTGPAQLSPDGNAVEVVPASSKANLAHANFRPIRPSSLGLPPIIPAVSSTARATPPRSDDGVIVTPKLSEPTAGCRNDPTKRSDQSSPTKRSPTRLGPKRLPVSPTGPVARHQTATANESGQGLASAQRVPVQERAAATRRSERIRAAGLRGRGIEVGLPIATADATLAAAYTNTLPNVPPSGVGDAAAATSAPPEEAHPKKDLVNAPQSSAVTTMQAGRRGIADRTGKKTTRQRQADPGHPQKKKRKLDDWED